MIRNKLCAFAANTGLLVYGARVLQTPFYEWQKAGLADGPGLNYKKRFYPGVHIERANIIIDTKTSVYDLKKEKQHYLQFCDQLIIVTLEPYTRKIANPQIKVMSSDDLLETLNRYGDDNEKKNNLIDRILKIQLNSSLEEWQADYENRFTMKLSK